MNLDWIISLVKVAIVLIVLGVGGYIGWSYLKPLLDQYQAQASTSGTSGAPSPEAPSLGAETTIAAAKSKSTYAYRPPKHFRAATVTPTSGALQSWSGTATAGAPETSFVVTVIACGEEEDESPRKDLEKYLHDTLPGYRLSDNKIIKDESLGGGTFIRVDWSGVDAQNRLVHGITYLGYHGGDQCGLTVYEPEGKQASELPIGEDAIKSFVKK
jgi:hypothetical protein